MTLEYLELLKVPTSQLEDMLHNIQRDSPCGDFNGSEAVFCQILLILQTREHSAKRPADPAQEVRAEVF